MTERRYLEFVHRASGAIGTRIEVTGKLEPTVAKVLRAMLGNAGADWYVRDTANGFRHIPVQEEKIHAPQ